MIPTNHVLICVIVGSAVAGVIARPFDWPEALWAVAGAVILTASGLMPVSQAMVAVRKGADVYCFLIGMMLLSNLARREGLFAWIAALAAKRANGSAGRLFALVYLIGIGVTVFLSNDATAVVLTPAVYASAKTAGAKPMPYLFICAFIANAASFVLPVSNPANLVVFRSSMPSLLGWLGQFALPSIISSGVTFAVLRWSQRKQLMTRIRTDIEIPALSSPGLMSGTGIGLTTVVLLITSLLGFDLGIPTLMSAAATLLIVSTMKREGPIPILREISWSVILLVAGLFVLVQAIESTDIVTPVVLALGHSSQSQADATALALGSGVAMLCNLVNNLPLGLFAGSVVQQAQLPQLVTGSVLLGIDLGPNLSVTGSLATILWLLELRKEGEQVTTWQFLKLGLLVMPPALVLSVAGLIFEAALFQ